MDELRERFGAVAAELKSDMNWQITDTGRKPRVVVLVSHEGHCLYDLLGRVAAGELDVDVRAVIGNHPTHAAVTRAHGIPFHHVAFPDDGDPDAKAAAFAQMRDLVEAENPDAIVLARFMQILPTELCAAWRAHDGTCRGGRALHPEDATPNHARSAPVQDVRRIARSAAVEDMTPGDSLDDCAGLLMTS